MSLLGDLKDIVFDDGKVEMITMCQMCPECWGHHLKMIAQELEGKGYHKDVDGYCLPDVDNVCMVCGKEGVIGMERCAGKKEVPNA